MKGKVLKTIKTKVFVSKLEMFSIVVLLIFITISSKLELHKSSFGLEQIPSVGMCVQNTFVPHIIFLDPGDPTAGARGVCFGLWVFTHIIIDTSRVYNWGARTI